MAVPSVLRFVKVVRNNVKTVEFCVDHAAFAAIVPANFAATVECAGIVPLFVAADMAAMNVLLSAVNALKPVKTALMNCV